MELISPELTFDHNRWPNWDLVYVCGLLAPEKNRDCHFWTNESCGLHVHIRVLQNPNPDLKVDNLEFLAIQNVIAVWGVYEKEIEKFHPDHRRAPHNKYAASLRSKAPYLPNDPAGSTADWLTHVYACRDFNDLRELVQNNTGVGDAGYSKINIVAYSPRDSDKARPDRDPTIEFREHAGSLDPFEITFWIAFVSKMVLFGVWLAQSGLVFDIEGAEKCAAEDLFDGLQIRDGMRMHYILKIMGEKFDHLFVALRRLAAAFNTLPVEHAQEISDEFEIRREGREEDEVFMLDLAKMINTGLGLAEAPDTVMGCRLLYYEQLYKYSPETMAFVRDGMLMAWAIQMQAQNGNQS
jgi:Putative amidoligase enzyme